MHNACLSCIVCIVQDYEPRYWYFEVLELLRKFFLSGVSLIFMPGTVSQSVFSVLVTLCAAVAYLKVQPFLNASDDRVSTVAQWALFVQLFAGLLLQMQDIASSSAAGPSSFASSFDTLALGQFIAVVIMVVPAVTICTVAYSQWVSAGSRTSTGFQPLRKYGWQSNSLCNARSV